MHAMGSAGRRRGGALVTMLVLGAVAVACGPEPSPTPSLAPSGTVAPPASASASLARAPSPSVATPSPSEASQPSDAPGIAPCVTADLAAVGGPVSGAAGSIGADVTVTASATCRLPQHAIVALVDADGRVVLAGRPAGPDGPTLDGGASRSFSFEFSNWCAENARTPLALALTAADGPVVVRDLAVTEDDLPPCNGPGQPPSLSTSEWRSG